MKTMEDLRRILQRIDGKGYKAYKDIQGNYSSGDYSVFIDHVQGDPFASPSRIRVRVAQKIAGFPVDTYHNKSREVALRDFITRVFNDCSWRFSGGNKGTGKSGIISIDMPGQEILERTSAFITGEYIETRFVMGLPAFGRRIASGNAENMFFKELPEIIRSSMFFDNIDKGKLYKHIEISEDADHLRRLLGEQSLIAFVADGAILPRKSGIDFRPLTEGRIKPFVSPDSLRVSVALPNRGNISGMGIPEGITLITGGGYHGKSTLLNALELGIYNHIPGDGREFVVSNQFSVKIRAEDGRRIEKTGISPFISNLPFGRDTVSFSTDDASGSTSQAANIIESIESGCRVLIIDEDTSATNFMIRDHRMQELVSKEMEPITPFVDKVRQLYDDYGISTLLVIGGSGDYFDVADRVICMKEYTPVDVTEEAGLIAEKYRTERKPEGGRDFGKIVERIPLPNSIDPGRGRRDVKISPRGLYSISFGTGSIDLGALEQLVDISQTRAIGDAIYYAKKNYMDGKRTMREISDDVISDVLEKGLDILSPYPMGDFAEFRGIDLAAALNRLRTLSVKHRGNS